jgi:hypothetical protein
MEIDIEEHEALKDDHKDTSGPVVHPLEYQEDLVELSEPTDLPRDVAVTKKRQPWICDTLQYVERHSSPRGTFRERKQPHSFLSHIES